MNVSLTPELVRIVNEKVRAGLYNNASEVVREGLRLLKERDELRLHRREIMREAIRAGEEDFEAGRFVEGTPGELLAEVKLRAINSSDSE